MNDDTDQAIDVQAEILPTNTLAALVRAEIDTQIATAKHWPRSLAQFKKTALSMATLNEEVAASCFYTLPRGGKPITGPSVRLAEICTVAWGNMRFGARVIADKGRTIVAQGFAVDLERNIAGTIEVERRITNKQGVRFSDDMVVVTGNAACAIARRNAIFSVLPMAYVKEIEREARKVAIGDAKTLVAKRAEMVGYFGKMGVEPARIFAAVGKAAEEDIGLEELAVLKGTATAIRDGDISVDEAFPPIAARPEAKPENGTHTDNLAERLRGKLPANAGATEAQAEPVKAELTQATNSEGGLQALIEDIRQGIDGAKSMDDLTRPGADMTRNKDALGQHHAELLALYQEKARRFQGKAKPERTRTMDF